MNVSVCRGLAAALLLPLLGLLPGCAAPARQGLVEAAQLTQRVMELSDQGKFAEAIGPARRALALHEGVLGPKHPNTARSLNDLGELYRLNGRNEEALALHKRALAIREEALGPEHPATAKSLNNVAGVYAAMGQYGQALPLYQRALDISERVSGLEHPDSATYLDNLADLFFATGRYDQAITLRQDALRIREKILGPEHPDTARTLNNMAALYATTGHVDSALPLAMRALAINEKALGSDHPETARSLNNLGVLYKDAGRFGEALPLYQRALAIDEKALGPEHPQAAIDLNNLASLYESIGQFDKALPLYQRALAIDEKALGPEHPEMTTILNNLAGLYQTTRQYDKSLPLYRRALSIAEKALGPDHPDTAMSLSNLAQLYMATGDVDQALPLHQRALVIKEKALGPDHPGVAVSLNNIAGVWRRRGDYDQALVLYQRALAIVHRANDPELAWSVNSNLEVMYALAPSVWSAARAPLAIWYGKQAVNALQHVREGMRSLDADVQRGFVARKERYYTLLAELLVQEGRIAEAEQVLAMLKERELFDLVHRSDVRKTQADDVGVERRASREQDELAARGAKYSSELAALERKARLEPLSAAESARKDELLKAAESWRSEYQRWIAGLGELFTRSGGSRAEAQAQGAQGTQLQTLVRAEAGAVGLHYIVSDERIAIIVATARGSFGRFSDVRREELNRQIAALRQAIVSRADVLPASQALYKALIAPVAQDLEEAQARTLVLSLTDTLRYVPFAALHDGKSYLIERYPLALYASAGGGQPKAGGTPWQVAALGLTQARLGFNPLPAVKGELEGIVRTDASPQGVLPGRIALDQAFDRARLQDALLGGYSVVHVASHFSFTPGDESRSVLLPGAGDPISLGQLAVMDFSHVQQLTLSACETATGGGANDNGAEVEGLAAAVQAQGAQSVLASLWKVSDASTAQLMRRFYAQHAQATPPTRAVALQQAQLALLRGAASDLAPDAQRSARPDVPVAPAATPTQAADPARPYAHPFFWAPFVLSGNWL